MNIKYIKNKFRNKDYFYTSHGDKERQNDNLLASEILEAINNGKIIENYPDTGRGKSCLVAGFTESGKPIHVVCGELLDKIAIITVYIPTKPHFKNLYERE